MGVLMDVVKQFFESSDWDYEQSPENESVFLTGVETDTGAFDMVIVADDTIHQLICFCAFPDEVPEDRRNDVAEYIVRANSTTLFGALDLDFDDGEARVRACANIADMTPSRDFVEMLVHGVVAVAESYYPGLQMVIQGDETPEDALDNVLLSLNDDEEDADDEEDEEKCCDGGCCDKH